MWGLSEYTENTRSCIRTDTGQDRWPASVHWYVDHGRALPTVRIIVPSSRTVSVQPTTIAQLISEQYMVVLHYFTGWDTNVHSLDYIFRSVPFKKPLPTAPQKDAWPRGRPKRLPLNIHETVMATLMSHTPKWSRMPHWHHRYGGNHIYIHQMSHIYIYIYIYIVRLYISYRTTYGMRHKIKRGKHKSYLQLPYPWD